MFRFLHMRFRSHIARLTLAGIIGALFTYLIAFAPSGNRYIFRMGEIMGQQAEPGTVSVFAMQGVAAAFIALAFWQAGRHAIADTMLRLPVSLFAACIGLLALFSALQAPDRLAGLAAAASVMLGALTFIAIILFRPDPREVLTGFVGGAVFQTGIGAWQFFTQEAFASKWLGMAQHTADQLGAYVIETGSGRWLRAYGSLSHPNVFGLYVGLGLLMCVGLAAYRGHGRHARFYAFMPIIAAGLLFSFSRSALLATVAGFIWMTVSAFGSEAAPDYRRVLVPSFMIIAATLGVLGSFYVDPIRTRATAEGRLEVASLTERRNQFQDASLLFSLHPFTGVGVGQMPIALASEAADGRSWWLYDYVHNVPALVAVELGFIGLVAWGAFIFMMLRIVRDRIMHRTPTSSGATAYAAAFIALLVASMFDHFLWSSWFGQLLFWTIAGLLYAANLDLHEKHHTERLHHETHHAS